MKYDLDGNYDNMTRTEWENEVSKILHERFGAPEVLTVQPDSFDMWSLGTTVREGVHAYKTWAIMWYGGLRL
jgi:hypothetical protein